MLDEMAFQRTDNMGIVVDDLEAVTAFFLELGMELEGEMAVEGRWADRVVGLDNGLRARAPFRRLAHGLQVARHRSAVPGNVRHWPRLAPRNSYYHVAKLPGSGRGNTHGPYAFARVPSFANVPWTR